MKDYIKSYFWVINLVFLLLGAWLLAGTINAVVAHKLRIFPSLPSRTPPSPPSRPEPSDNDNRVVVERNLFGSAMAEPVNPPEQQPEEPPTPLNDNDQGRPSDIRASLVGTVVASDKRWSMAMITDLTSSETNIYRINDSLLDEATVVAILSRRVVIRRGGSLEYLELQDQATHKRPTIRRTSPAARSVTGRSDLGKGIKKTGTNSWSIERGEIDKALSNLNNIAMQARIVPSFKNGQANGFKLFAIRPGSLYSKLGIQNGDVIHKINGYLINSPDKALEVYQKLKNARQVEIELTRRGQTKKLTYTID